MGKFQHAQHFIAGHQRQQAQRLDFIVPHLKQLTLVRGEFIPLVEIEHQHFLTLEHPLGQGTRLVDFALIVDRIVDVNVVRRENVQFAFTVAVQHHADGVDIEVVVDLFGHRADQFVHIQT